MKKSLVVALLSAFAAPSFAGTVDLTGFYAGANLGVGNASFSSPAGVTVTQPSSKPLYGVFGGYRYNENLAAEVGYTGISYFNTNVGAVQYLSKQKALYVAAVGTYPINDAFSVFGKLGVASASSENNAVAEQTTRRFGPTAGIGAQYKFTPAIAVRLTVDAYQVAALIPTTGVKQNSTATTANLGLVYSF